MIKVNNLTKTYGSRVLFENLNFTMTPRERLGLCGRNGSGKSTLFKLLMGIEMPDGGEIAFPKGYRVGHLAQHLEFHESSILKEVCLGLSPEDRHNEYLGEIMLDGLGFAEEDFDKPASYFSGGFQIRLNLAKLLLSEPDLLLLDEPTNYLDIVSMRWLEGFLRQWRGELIIISHDRSFMDEVVTHCMLIHRGQLRKVAGDTSKLYQQVDLDEEIYEKTRVNDEKKRKELEGFINRFRAQASKAALVQSRIKALERMGQSAALQDIQNLDFQFCEAPFPSRILAEIKNLSFGYDASTPLIQDINFVIGKKDRICVIGKNGKGKSTLLRLLSKELQPQSGEVSIHDNARLGYFGQSNIARLDNNLTIEGEVTSANVNHSRTKIRAICGTMMFSGDDALKKISVLSGGEKSRVLLGKILAQPTNLLLLDEPTNHLDMESIEALINSLESYDGAVVIVTHSELILKKLAQRLIVFEHDKPQVMDFGYDYFLDKIGWGNSEDLSSSNSKDQLAISSQVEKKNPANRKEIVALEKGIAKREAELKNIEQLLLKAMEGSDQEEIMKIAIKIEEIQALITDAYDRWEKLENKN